MTSSNWLADAPAWEHREVQRHMLRPESGAPILETSSGPRPLPEVRDQRRAGKPLEYILGHVHVEDLVLQVDERVLIPRPETETMVRLFIKHALPDLPRGPLLDCGTGSGFIAALLVRLQKRPVVAVDRYEEPLEVARLNREVTAVARYRLLRGDGLSSLRERSLAGVLANLPYVDREDPLLTKNVKRFEPAEALHPPESPTDFYDKIFRQVRRVLTPGGEAWFELSESLQDFWMQRLRGTGFTKVEGLRDSFGRNRFLRLVH